MKRVVTIVVLLLLSIVLFCGCDSHKGQVQIAGVWVDEKNLEKYDFKGNEAALKGDSYCKKCDKFIEGKVRICPYCGQYI